ncbi:MAG: hypothetical protein R3E12_01690 [Candidatus Eisenbacteria bacterium]
MICGLLSVNTYREFLVRDGQVPHLTWVVPIIILLPLLVRLPHERCS